jgi:hypothetical protein
MENKEILIEKKSNLKNFDYNIKNIITQIENLLDE